MRYVWNYFQDLTRKRTGTGYGPLPLQYSEILAYFTLHSIVYDSVEVEIIMMLDDVAMEHYIAEIKKDQERQAAKVKK